MKVFINSMKQFFIEVWNDAMLIVILFVPILAGTFFKFAIPEIEVLITEYFNKAEILKEYYLLFDLFLTSITPLMFSFVGAMVMLGEIDYKLSQYLAVTPLGKSGYLTTRIVIPTAFSIIYGTIISSIFSITGISLLHSVILSILNGIMGIIVSLLIVSISSNKVEGLALSKLSSILLVGICVPFFIDSPVQYIASFLPSYWMGKFVYKSSWIFIIPFLAFALLWLTFFYSKFKKKII